MRVQIIIEDTPDADPEVFADVEATSPDGRQSIWEAFRYDLKSGKMTEYEGQCLAENAGFERVLPTVEDALMRFAKMATS